MKDLLRFLAPPPETDLTRRLREQAAQFDPSLPDGLHRRISSALAETSADDCRPIARARRWGLAASGGLALIILGWILLPHGRSDKTAGPMLAAQPSSPPVISPAATAVDPLVQFAAPTPTALTQHAETPLQNEWENILSDLARARDTLTSVIPGVPRQTQGVPEGERRSALPTVPGV